MSALTFTVPSAMSRLALPLHRVAAIALRASFSAKPRDSGKVTAAGSPQISLGALGASTVVLRWSEPTAADILWPNMLDRSPNLEYLLLL